MIEKEGKSAIWIGIVKKNEMPRPRAWAMDRRGCGTRLPDPGKIGLARAAARGMFPFPEFSE